MGADREVRGTIYIWREGEDMEVQKTGSAVKMQTRLFTPAELMKPLKSGVTSNEFFLIDAFEKLAGDFVVQPKYDGIRVQIHKSGDKVVLFSDEKREIQDRFPGIVAAALALHGAVIVDGEIIKVEEGRPERHDVVSAYVHSKNSPDDTAFHVEAFDLIYQDGQLDGTPLSERWGKLAGLLHRREGKIKLIESIRTKGGKDLVAAIKQASTGEGAMVKDLASHYDRKYQDRWWKWKRQFEVDARVREVRTTETESVWVYVCEIGSGDQTQEIGRTYGTKIEAKVGDIIRVFVDHVQKSAAGKWSWYAPKVFEVRQDKTEPDPIPVLEQMLVAIYGGVQATKSVQGSKFNVQSSADKIQLGDVVPKLRKLGIPGLYLVGGLIENGYSDHDIDIVVRRPLSEREIQQIRHELWPLKDIDICVESEGPTGGYLEIIPVLKQESGVASKWVIQRHWWGQKEHFDLRFGSPRGDRMWGWTLFTDPRDKTKKHRTVEKKYHDPRWLTFEGDMQPGEPGNPTTNLIAHMQILEGGMYEFGGRKKDFVEVFLKDGKRMNGRFVIRLIAGRAASASQTGASPSEEGGAKTDAIWIAWLPKDQRSAFKPKD